MKKVTAALLLKDGKCLIARRPAHDPLAGFWEFPGGKIEANETNEACLAREMREEFGINVQVGKFFMDSTCTYECGCIHLLAYWAKWLNGDMVLRAHDAIAWVDQKTIMEYKLLPADVPIAEEVRKWL